MSTHVPVHSIQTNIEHTLALRASDRNSPTVEAAASKMLSTLLSVRAKLRAMGKADGWFPLAVERWISTMEGQGVKPTDLVVELDDALAKLCMT